MVSMQASLTKSGINSVDDDVVTDSCAKLAHPKYVEQFSQTISIHAITERLFPIQLRQGIGAFDFLQIDPEVVLGAYDS